jgi:radical SAM superfamily enzyme YgiQ (UPF0313 family)
VRIGILDILALPARHPAERAYRALFTKQFASITPQAISVWCRRLGHQTFYATYVGNRTPDALLPPDLDVLFLATYTQASPLAYALSSLYRRQGTRTVIGGPHARAFPEDCRRFFDVVVGECDEELIADILSGQVDPGTVVSSDTPFDDVPPVEERMPEIRISSFYARGRAAAAFSTIPMLASTGCPYRCDFCTDWNTPYRQLSTDRLAADLDFVARRARRCFLMFHDPNFAVVFDKVFDALEAQPEGRRPPYMFESSLTVLRGERMQRLERTNCAMVAPGVESWTDYSQKAAVGRARGQEKVDRVADHFGRLHAHVPYLQANLLYGLDTDHGRDPVDLTKAFMDATPFVWPAVNIPMPFGGTPMQAALLSQGRVLRAMPFGFYYAPYLVTILQNYDPVEYYENFVELLTHATSAAMLTRRRATSTNRTVRLIHRTRTAAVRASIRHYQEVLDQLKSDPAFYDFHLGRRQALPDFYAHRYRRMLGTYGSLLAPSDRTPVLAAERAGA